MKKGEKTLRTQHIARIAEFFLLETDSIYKKLKEETKVSNMHVKKAFEYIQNGLPYYDMNSILYEVCKEAGGRYMCEWHTHEFERNKYRTTQSLSCVCNGKLYYTKTSGIEGINSILEQIGFQERLSEPKDFINLVVWKEE